MMARHRPARHRQVLQGEVVGAEGNSDDSSMVMRTSVPAWCRCAIHNPESEMRLNDFAAFARSSVPVATLACVVALFSDIAHAQTRVSPGPTSATLREEFSGLTAVRELPDRRVVLADQVESRLVIADFAANSVVTVGRVGGGPGEYTRVRTLFP